MTGLIGAGGEGIAFAGCPAALDADVFALGTEVRGDALTSVAGKMGCAIGAPFVLTAGATLVFSILIRGPGPCCDWLIVDFGASEGP